MWVNHKIPRKKKKFLKKLLANKAPYDGYYKDIHNYLWDFKRPYINVATSIIYLDYPNREELIDWWNTHYPNRYEAKVVCKQNYLKCLTIEFKDNINFGYNKKYNDNRI